MDLHNSHLLEFRNVLFHKYPYQSSTWDYSHKLPTPLQIEFRLHTFVKLLCSLSTLTFTGFQFFQMGKYGYYLNINIVCIICKNWLENITVISSVASLHLVFRQHDDLEKDLKKEIPCSSEIMKNINLFEKQWGNAAHNSVTVLNKKAYD